MAESLGFVVRTIGLVSGQPGAADSRVSLSLSCPGMRRPKPEHHGSAQRMLCGHLFCTGCIREWLREANTCPAACAARSQREQLLPMRQWEMGNGRLLRFVGTSLQPTVRISNLDVLHLGDKEPIIRGLQSAKQHRTATLPAEGGPACPGGSCDSARPS